jgi:predicted DNA-binding ribbon-helix-helix protein
MEYKTLNVKIEQTTWRDLKQLALDKNMTLQSEVNEILKSFLDCVKENVEENKIGKEN